MQVAGGLADAAAFAARTLELRPRAVLVERQNDLALAVMRSPISTTLPYSTRQHDLQRENLGRSGADAERVLVPAVIQARSVACAL